MAVYIGKKRVNFYIGNSRYNMNLPIVKAITEDVIEGIFLMSLDNYILQDKNGMYLSPLIEEGGMMNVSRDN